MNKKYRRSTTPLHRTVLVAVIILMVIAALFSIYHIIREKPTMQSNDLSPTFGTQSSSTNTGEETALLPDKANSNREINHKTRKDDCFTFLLAASDQSSGNADVIMVATYDTVNQTVGVVSIPRDTLIDPSTIPSKFPKINSAYQTGIDCLEEVVANMLGIPIDYHFTIDTEGFVALVDSIGGIDFDVPIHMSYDDPAQGLSIHFEPGMQHLTGSEALAVCRLRSNQDGTIAYPDYDIGRTRTQQALLKAIAAKALSQPTKIKEYVDIFTEYCTTDLSIGNIVWLAESAMGVNLQENVHTSTLPGNGEVTYNGVSYCYELYEDEVLDLVNELLNPYLEPRTAKDLNIFISNG